MIEIVYNSKFKQLILDSLKYFLDQFFPQFVMKKITISINSNEGLCKRATVKTPPPNRWGPLQTAEAHSRSSDFKPV